MENITLEGTELFNSTREPWYQYVRRSKNADTLGYLKHQKFNDEGFPIQLVRNFDKDLENLQDKDPYDIMIDLRPDFSWCRWDTTSVIRLGTVFIAKSEEVSGNEQSLLHSIISEPEIEENLENLFKNLNY